MCAISTPRTQRSVPASRSCSSPKASKKRRTESASSGFPPSVEAAPEGAAEHRQDLHVRPSRCCRKDHLELHRVFEGEAVILHVARPGRHGPQASRRARRSATRLPERSAKFFRVKPKRLGFPIMRGRQNHTRPVAMFGARHARKPSGSDSQPPSGLTCGAAIAEQVAVRPAADPAHRPYTASSVSRITAGSAGYAVPAWAGSRTGLPGELAAPLLLHPRERLVFEEARDWRRGSAIRCRSISETSS